MLFVLVSSVHKNGQNKQSKNYNSKIKTKTKRRKTNKQTKTKKQIKSAVKNLCGPSLVNKTINWDLGCIEINSVS